MYIDLAVSNSIGIVTIQRAEKKNAMLLSMRDELADLCVRIHDDDAIRAVVFTGAGSDFCAGADISEMAKGGIGGSQLRARHMARVIGALNSLDKPIVGAVRGVALGMGLSMALSCDYIVAGRSLKMGCVQRKIGLAPDAGNVWFLTRYLGVQKAKELVFSARVIGGEEALMLGLVSKLVDDDLVLDEALAMAATFSDAPTLAIAAAKRMFDAAPAMSLTEFLTVEGNIIALNAQSEDFKEGTRSFLEKRAPRFSGN